MADRRTRSSLSTAARLVAVLLALLMVAAACGGDDDDSAGGDDDSPETTEAGDTTGTTAEEGTPKSGGSITIGLESDVSTLDPGKQLAQPADKDIALAVYDPLLNWDDEGKNVPYLATDFKSNESLDEWTITLPEGVKFHDGTDFNADAVVTHFKRLQDPATGSPSLTDVQKITEITAPDPTTVVFKLEGPDVAFPNLLSGTVGYIESPAAVAKFGPDYPLNPVGTGPFKVTEFTPGSQVVVEKNPDYWKTDDDGNQLPYLDKITFRPIPDSKVRLQSIQAGDVDLIQTADTSTVVEAEEDDNLVIQKVTGSSSTIVLLNQTKPPFDNPKARQAVAYATDKDAINDVVWAGTRTPSYSAFAPGDAYFNEDAASQYRYDPDKAAALVEELGGLKFKLECIPTPEATQLLELQQQMYEQAGMDVEIATQEQGAYVAKIFGTKDYEAACFRNNQLADPDQLYGGIVCGGEGNLVGYCNEKVDAALEKGRSTDDFEERKKQYDIIQEQTSKDIVTITLAYDIFGNIHTKQVKGLPTPEKNSLGAIKPAYLWLDA